MEEARSTLWGDYICKHQDQWFCVCYTFRWEYDESYCEAVKKMPPYDAGPRLLDVIDTAIFDYLIGNADRHHYESFQDDGGASMLILLDNAKRRVTARRISRSVVVTPSFTKYSVSSAAVAQWVEGFSVTLWLQWNGENLISPSAIVH